MRKPNLFIVGAPKCGTSALHKFLKQHPDIFMSEPKELQYFCKDLIQESDEFYKKNKTRLKRNRYYTFRTERDYLAVFANWKAEKIAGESSPSYMFSKVAAKEIHRFNPDAKIIIMIRNPVNFLYSLHSHALMSGHETEKDFKKALDLEKERKSGKRLPNYSLLSQPSKLYYSERAKFSEQIQRYLDVFDRKQVKIIVYDDFQADNDAVYQDVLRFLGVKSFTPKYNNVNVNKKVRFKKLKIALESKAFSHIFILPKKLLPDSTYTNLRSFLYNKILMKTQPRTPMDSELRTELMKKYKSEVEKLSSLTDIDLISLWKYNQID